MWGTHGILRVWWAPMHQQAGTSQNMASGQLPICSLGALLSDASNNPPALMQLRQGILYCWVKESSSLCMSLRKKETKCLGTVWKQSLLWALIQGPCTAMTLMFNRSTHQTHDSLLGAPHTLAKLWVMDCNWRLFSACSFLKGPCCASQIRTAVLLTVLWWCVFTLIGHISSCGWLGRWFLLYDFDE